MSDSETNHVGVPQLHTMPVTACPACHSKAARTIPIGDKTLKRCKDCDLVYAPLYADPEAIYVEGYFSGEIGAFGLDTRHPEFDEYLDYVGEIRMDMIEQVVPGPGRILDVGCGPGHTLVVARNRGWDASGVDLVADAVKIAVERYGLDVRCSMLEDSGLPERSFDVVAATHVLEHQVDGIDFLTSIARWVKPGGCLFIEVPNWASVDRLGNAEQWFGLRPLEHLAHYTPQTLAKLMERIGFEPLLTRTPFYQFHRQTIGQALHDFGLSRLTPYLRGPRFTVEGKQRDEPVRVPNPTMRKVLGRMGQAAGLAKAGVVIVMMARVP
ncbi:MAG TPA: class I SAM-dependent methyltransferase [Acidimicrobiales bacterium]|nr:class I SAM-dependent methyltransferase [Acidimicrobiales bacterium]